MCVCEKERFDWFIDLFQINNWGKRGGAIKIQRISEEDCDEFYSQSLAVLSRRQQSINTISVAGRPAEISISI